MISYQGIDEATLLVALYHGTAPLGMGFLHNDPGFDKDEAEKLLAIYDGDDFVHLDYIAGRPIKVTFDRIMQTFNPVLYDRDAGAGVALRVVERLRAGK